MTASGSDPLSRHHSEASVHNKSSEEEIITEYQKLSNMLIAHGNYVSQDGNGESRRGIFYTVKGKLMEENVVEFDFHRVLFREVKACKKELYRKKRKKKTTSQPAEKAFSFPMTGMGAGMY